MSFVWFKAKDVQPKHGLRVLANQHGTYYLAVYTIENQWAESGRGESLNLDGLYWRYLPPAPEGGDADKP